MADDGYELKGESLGGAFVEVRADMSSLASDLNAAQSSTIAFAKAASDAATVKVKTVVEPPAPASISSFGSEQQIRAEIARTRLAMKADLRGGYEVAGQGDANRSRISGLTSELEKLRTAQQSSAFVAKSATEQQTQYATATMGAGHAAANARGGMQSFGMGVLFVSQAIEDAQYGFRAIVNNIPSIAMAFGAGPGLAGTISLLGVGINVVTQNWETFKSSFSDGSWAKTAISGIEDVYSTLTDASTKEAKSKAEAQSKARAKATEAFAGEGSTETERKGAAIAGALKDYGTGKAIIGELLRKQLPQIDAEAQKRADAARDQVKYMGASGVIVRDVELDNAKKGAKREEERRNMVGDMLSKARDGDPAAIQQLLDATKGTKLGQRLKNSLQASQEQVEANSPQMQAIKKEMELQKVADEAAMQEAEKARQDQERQTNKDIDKQQARLRGEGETAARSMMGTLGLDMLQGKDKDYTQAAKDALLKSGKTETQATELASLVVSLIEDQIKERVDQRSLQDNTDPKTAARREALEVASQEKQRAQAALGIEMNTKSSIVGLSEMVNRIQTARVDGSGNNPAEKTFNEIKAFRGDMKKYGSVLMNAMNRGAKFNK